ncbi:ArnT family glycosyltransferase [Granulicella arctica]|uniref:ArnT family glycosyltransferase n=1 Tax=Granulicella arctica TaxID=940613 RepID=UPI0032B2F715
MVRLGRGYRGRGRRDEAFRAPWLVFWVAFVVRVGYIVVTHRYRIPAYLDHFSYGWEMGRVGRALATGHGYADPFQGHTGPTAWVTPLYPMLVGGVFRLFGVYTPLSAFVLLAVNSVFSAYTARTTWEIGVRCFNPRIAVWAAWIWALYPAAMQYATKWIWEMTLTTFLFSCVLVLALRMRNVGGVAGDLEGAATVRRWACFGLLWALIALSNPSLLVFLPVCGVWILMGIPQWQQQIAGVVLAACLFLVCVSGWSYRNWLALHRFVPLRTNFGAELYLGNGPGANGIEMGYEHPAIDHAQLELYRELGEVEYSRMRGDAAKALIRERPGRFAVLCVKRAYFFWFGAPHVQEKRWSVEYGPGLHLQFTSIVGLLGLALALRRRVPAAGLFAWVFVLLPATYYLVTVHPRFRHPLEPLMVILGVFLFQSAEKSWRVRWFSRGAFAA